MRTPLRAHVLRTRYPHMGAYAGMVQLPRAFDPREVTAQVITLSDGDDDCRVSHPLVRAGLRRLGGLSGMAWYRLSDVQGEWDAGAAVARDEVDIVHYLDGEHSAQFLPRLLRRIPRRRVRTVGTFHQPPAMLDALLDRRAVAALDLITVVSPTQVEWFTSRVPRVPVEVVLHGIDTDFFSPDPHGRRCDEPRDGSTPLRCITVGHWLRDWTAMRGVVERAARAGNIEFHVVTSRETGLDGLPNVMRYEALDDGAFLALYRSCDVLLLPLVDATANNALLEAMSCGLPVVTTDTPSLRAYVPDDAGVLIPGNDPDAIMSALEWLACDPRARVAMGARGRARAESLAWPRVAADVARLYRRLSG